MADQLPEATVRYTEKDFDSLRSALFSFSDNRFPGVVTDKSSTSVYTIFIELLAYLGDQLAFYQDAQAREAFFTTAKLRSSLLKHAKLIGYKPTGRVAASLLLNIQLIETSAFPTLIPAGTFFRTADESPVLFRVLDDATLPAGPAGTFIEIYLEHSTEFLEYFQADGNANETFVTNATNVLLSGIDGSGSALTVNDVLKIFVDGIPYTIVDSFVSSGPTDTHVVIDLDNQNRAIVQFGDGINGVAANGDVIIQGRSGGGISGNNATVTQSPSFTNTNSEPVSISVGNLVQSSGGADEQSIESIKVQAPRSLQTNNRTVSASDFIINTESVSGIDRALPLTSNEDPGIEENKTEILVLTESPTNAQLIGGNAAATSLTGGVDDQVSISINGETPQEFTIGTQASGEDIAAALQALVRAATPEYPLDHDEAYANFTVVFDSINQRYLLTTGSAGIDATLEVSAGTNDGHTALKLDLVQRASNVSGAQPSATAIASVVNELTVVKPVCITHVIEVIPPQPKIINLDFRIRFTSNVTTAASRSDVRDAVRESLETFFSPRLTNGIANPEIDFGKTVRFSDLICAINQVSGVESVDEDTLIPADDVTLALREFPVLGGIIVRDEAGVVI